MSELVMVGLFLAQAAPDPRFLFILSVLAVSAVILFALAAAVLLIRRGDRRRLEVEKLRAVGMVTARILHQVKNPLQTVLLQAELLQEQHIAEDPVARREACEAIVGEAQRLGMMLNELGTWAGGSRRMTQLHLIPLHDLVYEIARQEQITAARAGIELHMPHIEPATVRADAYLLRQALENLLRNAREALAETDDATITLQLMTGGDSALIHIADNGPGIERERIRTIFEPFVTTKGKGMGLGLPICKEIIEAHGGRLAVESRPGAGATFRTTLPLAVAGATTTAATMGGRAD